MKRNKLLVCIYLVLLTNVYAQKLEYPSQTALDNVQSICAILGIPQIPVYISFSTEYACSTVVNGRATILYNPYFLDYISPAGQGGPIYVFAHEIGHIANLDLSWYGSFTHRWTMELRADYIGGYVLGCMGFSVDEALDVHKYVLFKIYDTPNYPNSLIRMDAIIAGYMHAFE